MPNTTDLMSNPGATMEQPLIDLFHDREESVVSDSVSAL